jgi:hypothetical protein
MLMPGAVHAEVLLNVPVMLRPPLAIVSAGMVTVSVQFTVTGPLAPLMVPLVRQVATNDAELPVVVPVIAADTVRKPGGSGSEKEPRTLELVCVRVAEPLVVLPLTLSCHDQLPDSVVPGVVPPLWEMFTDAPATAIAPLRLLVPLFAWTVTVTEPEPLPLPGLTAAKLLPAAVQEQLLAELPV